MDTKITATRTGLWTTSIATSQRGIWAVKWSFTRLFVTALLASNLTTESTRTLLALFCKSADEPWRPVYAAFLTAG
jgi:hypothetical protein